MTPARQRLQIRVEGIVQGVGFRPHVYRLARDLKLTGWVRNHPQGVDIEVEGPGPSLESFLCRLSEEAPPFSRLQEIRTRELPLHGDKDFSIHASGKVGAVRTLLLPDLAPCPQCLQELRDPANRRFRHPFLNCTHCGPRYSIVREMPYDRARTTLRDFPLCPACQQEFGNPADRRFHAQPVACPHCGPQLRFEQDGTTCDKEAALTQAIALLRAGGILALKGLGGFQLLVDARNAEAVERLRARKHRSAKPFALLYRDRTGVQHDCELNPAEQELLQSAAAPIVLLQRRRKGSDWIAPGLHEWGVMLPASPLHVLIMESWATPLVATSGNLSEEPLCIDNQEARKRLAGIADGFLGHNRPIARAVDDSVVRVVAGREQVLRRARGYAPLPIELPEPLPPSLALGGHLKNTIAVGSGTRVFISQYIGDLESPESCHAFQRTLADLPQLMEIEPRQAVHDLHPDYHSTQVAGQLGLPTLGVQHHEAHAWAGAAEHHLSLPALALVWDGTGYGHDGSVWGGEVFRLSKSGAERIAHLRPFPLPGGEAAVREPRRSALGLLAACMGPDLDPEDPMLTELGFSRGDIPILLRSLRLGSPVMCSSMGRLFDAVSALCGFCTHNEYEGQAAIVLEHAASLETPANGLPLTICPGIPAQLDWEPWLTDFLSQQKQGKDPHDLAAQWHETLAATATAIAEHAGLESVLLTGGCFQNRRLTERCLDRLQTAGFRPYIPLQVPPNDGGIAFGQLASLAYTQLK